MKGPPKAKAKIGFDELQQLDKQQDYLLEQEKATMPKYVEPEPPTIV
jgi:hypothetical protein